MSCKLNYQLLQQTPMIHFQSDDMGATLRGSELKPKLDRFIRNRYSREHGEEVPASWKVGNSDALRYAVSLRALGTPTVTDPSSKDSSAAGIYFGNTGNDSAKKMSVSYEEPIDFAITCFVPDLRQLIGDCVQDFFAGEAFGTRQNRGFGCFAVKGTTPHDAERSLVREFGDDRVYKIDYGALGSEIDSERMLGDAYVIYRVLNSGINEPGRPYVKGFLTKYFLMKGIGGEKRFLKAKGIAPAVGNGSGLKHEDPKNGYRYTRALLGTTDGASYLRKQGSRDRARIRYKSNDVERFASPVLVRVCGSTLFLVAAEPDEGIYGRRFGFSLKKKSDSLRVPSKEEFGSMKELFEEYVSWLNHMNQGRNLDDDQKQLVEYGTRNRGNSVVFISQKLPIQLCN